MSLGEPTHDKVTHPAQEGFALGDWGYGLANLMVTVVLALLLWFMFVDPEVSLTRLYPQPFGLFLFWSILALVFLAFCWEMWPLSGLRQPQKGLLALAVGTAVALVAIMLLNYGYGQLDPAFRLGDLVAPGWTSSGMVVLIGFYMWGMLSGNWGHWPWRDAGLVQPALGMAEFLTGLGLTLAGYLILIYPNVAVWSGLGSKVLPLSTVVGWYYSVIVSCFTTANLLDNWPWASLSQSRAVKAITSFVGNFVLGTCIYWLFLYMLKSWLVPVEAQPILGEGIKLWPAQLGVTFVFWVLAWALMFSNFPRTDRPIVDYPIRLAIVLLLAIVTFVIYTHWFAVHVLHEPSIAGSFGGDPLTFMDWLIYVMMVYLVYFESYGLRKRSQG